MLIKKARAERLRLLFIVITNSNTCVFCKFCFFKINQILSAKDDSELKLNIFSFRRKCSCLVKHATTLWYYHNKKMLNKTKFQLNCPLSPSHFFFINICVLKF